MIPRYYLNNIFVLFRDASGIVSTFDLEILIENEQTESVLAWRGRTNRRPYKMVLNLVSHLQGLSQELREVKIPNLLNSQRVPIQEMRIC